MAHDGETPALPSACDEHPEFDLTYLYDDSEHPSEVTVMPYGETSGQTTTWLSASIEDAVPVEEIR